MLKLGDELDTVVLKWVNDPHLTVNDIAGVLAHRLGSLIKCSKSSENLLAVCTSILSRQAKDKNGG